MILISLVPLITSGLLVYASAEQGFRLETFRSAEQHARDVGTNFNGKLVDHIEIMTSLGHAPTIYDACITGLSWNKSELYASYEGTKFGAEDSADDLPVKTAKTWDPSNDPVPEASQYLEDFTKDHTDYLEIFITDTRGYNVVTMTSIPGDFDQGGEGWFTDTVANDLFTEYEFDESANAAVYTVSVKLKTRSGQFYGVLKAAVSVANIFGDLPFYGDGFGVVIDKGTMSIVSTLHEEHVGEPLDEDTNMPEASNPEVYSDSLAGSGSLYGVFNGITYFAGYYAPENSDFISIVLVPQTVYSEPVNAVLLVLIITVFAVIVIAFTVSLFIARSIANPVAYLAKVTNEVANGDLTADIKDFNRKDEVGKLAGAFKYMVVSLRDLISKTGTVGEKLSSAAEEFASSAEEINASSEEISSVIQQMNRGAQQQAEQIGATVRNVEELSAIAEKTTQDIASTVELIADVASQTNMLSLNAQIEAARAGDFGKSFMVVADNVRRLAEDTKASTVSIQDLVVDIQHQISGSVDKIAKAVDSVAAVAEETAASSEEASAASEEQTATMEEMSASSQDLANLSEELMDTISVFKLDSSSQVSREHYKETSVPQIVEREQKTHLVKPLIDKIRKKIDVDEERIEKESLDE
ncbi:MAG: methyl-accepting chemotaxis protein [Candidatus Hodarchaeales archaeon]|jgi:methyl-accepting chemotaxis protein